MLFIVGSYNQGDAQALNSLEGLRDAVTAFNEKRDSIPVEKVYIHFDKPRYAPGDTIWFKAYLFNGDGLHGSKKSRILYMDIENQQHALVKRVALPVIGGLSWGCISLDTADFTPGRYLLRAYTSWMLNFGEDYVFVQSFSVMDNHEAAWTTSFTLTESPTAAWIYMTLKDLMGRPVQDRKLSLQVTDGEQRLIERSIVTDDSGRVTFNLPLPAKAPHKYLLRIKGDSSEYHQFLIPFLWKRWETLAMAFFPEGGRLLPGYVQRIGFRVKTGDGKGAGVSGIVVNRRGDSVTAFSSSQDGIGSFFLRPARGEKYSAVVKVPGGGSKTFLLPVVETKGTGMQAKILPDKDVMQVRITAVGTVAHKRDSLVLLVQAPSGKVTFSVLLKQPADSDVLNIPLAGLPPGLLYCMLLNPSTQVLNQRLIFLPVTDSLDVKVEHLPQRIMPFDSIPLVIHVQDQTGAPVRGSFSVAVIDNNQMRGQASSRNIVDYMGWASSIQDSFHISVDGIRGGRSDMDELMLVSRWKGPIFHIGTDEDIKVLFRPETGLAIRGKVINPFNRPVRDAHVDLLSWNPPLQRTTVTDGKGVFVFDHFPALDTAQFFLQARNRRNKKFLARIELDTLKRPLWSYRVNPIFLPWSVNPDTSAIRFLREKAVERNEKELTKGTRVLGELVVKAKKIVKFSQNLNGPGNADIVIDQDQLKKYADLSVFDVLMKTIPELHMDYEALYKNYVVEFIMDGMNLRSILDHINVETELKSISASELYGIEMMLSPRYVNPYIDRFMDVRTKFQGGDERGRSIAFIEITTRSGKSIFERPAPGIYIYRPLPFSWPHPFYSPNYSGVSDVDSIKDYRSTLYWNPDVETDTAGKAHISFYNSRAKDMTIVVQGSDMAGHLGFRQVKVESLSR